MTGRIAERLSQLGLVLPPLPEVPFVEPLNRVAMRAHGDLAYVSGIGPIGEQGVLGDTLTVEQGYESARRTALNMLARLEYGLGSLDAIASWIRILGFVRSTAAFEEHPLVLNGFSDLIVDVFGDEGRCARSAIGTSALPLGMPIEVEAVVSVKPRTDVLAFG